MNGTHSLLAYLGGCSASRHGRRGVGRRDLVAAAQRLAEEDLVPTLRPFPASTSPTTASNSHAAGRTRDRPPARTSRRRRSEAPVRFGEPARERIAAGPPPRWIALALAAYISHSGTREILDAFPAALHEHVDDWLERFAADGPRSALRAG